MFTEQKVQIYFLLNPKDLHWKLTFLTNYYKIYCPHQPERKLHLYKQSHLCLVNTVLCKSILFQRANSAAVITVIRLTLTGWISSSAVLTTHLAVKAVLGRKRLHLHTPLVSGQWKLFPLRAQLARGATVFCPIPAVKISIKKSLHQSRKLSLLFQVTFLCCCVCSTLRLHSGSDVQYICILYNGENKHANVCQWQWANELYWQQFKPAGMWTQNSSTLSVRGTCSVHAVLIRLPSCSDMATERVLGGFDRDRWIPVDTGLTAHQPLRCVHAPHWGCSASLGGPSAGKMASDLMRIYKMRGSPAASRFRSRCNPRHKKNQLRHFLRHHLCIR